MTAIEDRLATLLDYEFASAAHHTATMIERHGFCYTALTPGDSTKYEISIITPPAQWQQRRYDYFARTTDVGRVIPFSDRFSGSYFVSTQFGRLYRWEGEEIGDWTYVWEKWTLRRGGPTDTDAWTAHILLRFLNTLAPLLPAKPERKEARID